MDTTIMGYIGFRVSQYHRLNKQKSPFRTSNHEPCTSFHASQPEQSLKFEFTLHYVALTFKNLVAEFPGSQKGSPLHSNRIMCIYVPQKVTGYLPK